eukprot:5731412-Heterocapsa_arctica.AAC.1
MVLFKESDNENFAVEGIIADLDRTNRKLKAIGQRLNDGKEQILVPFKSTEIKFRENIPDYKGKVGQVVVDLGITHRTHNRASINKGKRVGDTNKVVKRAQALALVVREKVNIIKTAGQSTATYGAATDPFTQAESNRAHARRQRRAGYKACHHQKGVGELAQTSRRRNPRRNL